MFEYIFLDRRVHKKVDIMFVYGSLAVTDKELLYKH